MKKPLTTTLCAALLCAAGSAHAIMDVPLAPPVASATIDWSSLNFQLFDLDPLDGIAPTLTWQPLDQNTYVGASSSLDGWSGDSAADWSSAISASEGAATGWADAGVLGAELGGLLSEGWNSASADRSGSFQLSAKSLVLFTIDAVVSAQQLAGGNLYAWASLDVFGTNGYGLGYQGSSSGIDAGERFGEAVGSTLAVSFMNPSTQATTGTLTAWASVDGLGIPPVPEPETYAMMLAGLAMLGFTARRRMR